MSSYTLTLSRAHSVTRRIAALATAREADLTKVLAGTSLEAVPSEEQRSVLDARGASALKDVDFVARAIGTCGAIRRAIAAVNAEKGVSQRLASVAASRQVSAMYDRILNTDLARLPSLDQLPSIVAQRSNAAPGYGEARAIRVRLVAADALESLRSRKASLDAAVMAESDEINDLNRAMVKVEIDDDIAAEVGLRKA